MDETKRKTLDDALRQAFRAGAHAASAGSWDDDAIDVDFDQWRGNGGLK